VSEGQPQSERGTAQVGGPVDRNDQLWSKGSGLNYRDPADKTTSQSSSNGDGIPLLVQGGTFVIPVLINGQITLNFTIDSGASDVSIPADVVSTLIRTGTFKKVISLAKRLTV